MIDAPVHVTVDQKVMMRPGFPSTAVRPFTAAAAAGILTLGLVTAPPTAAVALPRTEAHAVALASVDVPMTVTPASTPRPAASQTANDSATPPDFLAFAASILDYLNSLGLGAGPGLAAIGLSGFVVAFAATAYAWNGFANTVNPGLRFLRLPPVPKFPVCFAGQKCATGAASAQARVIKPTAARANSVKPAGRGAATSKRAASDKNNTSSAKVRGAKKSTPSAAAKARSAR